MGAIKTASVLTVLALTISRPAWSRETPAGGASNALKGSAESIYFCGLVETTQASDWVFVTSDHILRSFDCVAECEPDPDAWWDRVIHPSCYLGTRYWAFAPGFSSACVFQLKQMGGTLNGLYVGWNVSFHLYNQSGTYVAEGTGPQFVTLDYWYEVEPPCDESVWGQLLVPGGCGALAGYSIILFTEPFVDVRLDANNDGSIDHSPMPPDCSQSDPDEMLEDDDDWPGLLLPVNNNDSDSDGVPDNLTSGPDGPADEADFRDVYVRACLPAEAEYVHIFFPNGAKVYDDQWVAQWWYITLPASDFQSCGWKHFRIEGDTVDESSVHAYAERDGWFYYGEDRAPVTVYEVRSFFPDDEDLEAPEEGILSVTADDLSLPFVTSIERPYSCWHQSSHPGDGSRVAYSVASGSATLSTSENETLDGYTSTYVTPLTEAGSTFRLRSKITQLNDACSSQEIQTDGIEHVSPEITVIAGRPDNVQVSVDGGVGQYPASEANTLGLRVTSRDAHWNTTPNGTGVVAGLKGDGAIDPATTDTGITGGTSHVGTIAGFAAGVQEVTVEVGERDATRAITQVPINITLARSAPFIPAGSDQFVDIEASVIGVGGRTVANGTQIVWATSLGSFADDTGVRYGPVAVTTVVDGQSVVRLHTSKTDVDGQVLAGTDQPGTARIMAAIGLSQGRTEVVFTEPVRSSKDTSQPVRLQLDHWALAGDATEDGLVEIDEIDFESRYEAMINIGNQLGAPSSQCPTCDRDSDGTITLVDLIHARNAAEPAAPVVPYYAATTGTITGDPFDVVHVTVSDPSAITVVGLDANGNVTLDASGQATITLRSTGALTTDRASVKVTVTRVWATAGSLQDDQDEVTIAVVAKEVWGWVYNFGAGAIWGGGEGATAFAGDIATSFFLYGDIRDIGVEMSKLWPGGDQPDTLVIGFAAAGVVTTFTGPGDAAVTIVKRVLKQLNRLIPGSSAAKNIGRMIQDLLKHVRDTDSFLALYNEWKVFLDVLANNDEFVKLIVDFGDDLIQPAKRMLGRLGESWAGYLVKAGARGAGKVVRVIDAVDDATVALIKGWPAARQERLVMGLAACSGKTPLPGETRWVGRVDDDVLQGLVRSDYIAAIEDVQSQFPELGTGFDVVMEQLGKVAANGTENTDSFALRLKLIVSDYVREPTGNLARLKGHLNELLELERLVDDPSVHLLETGAAVPYGRVPKQLDAVAELVPSGQKVIYEFKHGTSFANPGTEQRKNLIRQIMGRVEIAKRPGSLNGAKIRVQLTGGTWSPSLKQELIDLGNSGIVVEVVP